VASKDVADEMGIHFGPDVRVMVAVMARLKNHAAAAAASKSATAAVAALDDQLKAVALAAREALAGSH
jgi:hypothetical protein